MKDQLGRGWRVFATPDIVNQIDETWSQREIVRCQFLPAFSSRAQPWMNRIGNAVLMAGIIAILWVMRATLAAVLSWWLPAAALLLALGSVAAIRLLVRADDLTERTLSICNARIVISD